MTLARSNSECPADAILVPVVRAGSDDRIGIPENSLIAVIGGALTRGPGGGSFARAIWARMSAFWVRRGSPSICTPCPLCAVLSTDRRNTYLGMRAWSEGHEEEVLSSWVYRGAERGALGALEEG